MVSGTKLGLTACTSPLSHLPGYISVFLSFPLPIVAFVMMKSCTYLVVQYILVFTGNINPGPELAYL